MRAPDEALCAVLEEAQARGFVGTGSLSDHLEHARGFASALASIHPDGLRVGSPDPVLDLGSGGGLPGLVLAMECWPGRMTLLDANGRRAGFLEAAVSELGLAGRVAVLQERAELAGRAPGHRGAYQVVVARAFGRPAVTAECAAPLLRPGGHLVASEPPGGDTDRWSAEQLQELGFGAPRWVAEERCYVVVPMEGPCPHRYPRRTGVPAKRPLF